MGYLIVALVAIGVAVFAMQNTTPVTVRFAVWQLTQVSLAAVILVALCAGIVLAGVPMWIRSWRLRGRLRALERKSPPPPPSGDPGA